MRYIITVLSVACAALSVACVDGTAKHEMRTDTGAQLVHGKEEPLCDTGARECATSGDCRGRDGVPECHVDVCVHGFCQTVHDAFGVFCGDVPEVCDGRGECGEWMSQATLDCYVPEKLSAFCPLCDDGDPATHDNCEAGADGAEVCNHYPAKDGYVCGPNYIVQNGKCCPAAIVGP